MAAAVRHDPDLEQRAGLVLHVELAVLDPGPRAHHLHIARDRPALVAQTVLVADRPGAHVGDDFHVIVRVRRKAAVRRDHIIVPHPQGPPLATRRIVVSAEREVVMGIQPTVIGGADGAERAKFDHGKVSKRQGLKPAPPPKIGTAFHNF